jgi:NADH-quinone oxidoreductase subunit E
MACKQCKCEQTSILDAHPDKQNVFVEYMAGLTLSDDLEKRRGQLIPCLHKAQGLFGYLPLEIQELVGKTLRLQQADVYGVISFYSFFTDVPVGKYKINVCTGTACFVKGADKILDEFKQQLKIEDGQTTDDKVFSLGALRCVGACSLAPVVMVNDKVYGNVTAKMVTNILKDCQ